jgi:hypothetical protein
MHLAARFRTPAGTSRIDSADSDSNRTMLALLRAREALWYG